MPLHPLSISIPFAETDFLEQILLCLGWSVSTEIADWLLCEIPISQLDQAPESCYDLKTNMGHIAFFGDGPFLWKYRCWAAGRGSGMEVVKMSEAERTLREWLSPPSFVPLEQALSLCPALPELCLFACLFWTWIRKKTGLVLRHGLLHQNYLCLLLCGVPAQGQTQENSPRARAWQTCYSGLHTRGPRGHPCEGIRQLCASLGPQSTGRVRALPLRWPQLLAGKRLQMGVGRYLSLSATDRHKGIKPLFPLSKEDFETFLLVRHSRHPSACWGSVQWGCREGRIPPDKDSLENSLILLQAFDDRQRDQETAISHLLGYTDNWGVFWDSDWISLFFESWSLWLF